MLLLARTPRVKLCPNLVNGCVCRLITGTGALAGLIDAHRVGCPGSVGVLAIAFVIAVALWRVLSRFVVRLSNVVAAGRQLLPEQKHPVQLKRMQLGQVLQ